MGRKHHRTLKNAKHAFDSYDVDGDGEITYEELVGGMGGDYSANEISAIFAMGDIDQDGKISFLEFSKIMIPSCQDTLTKFWKCFRNVQGVRETFKKFDADGDAQISRQEVIQGASSSGMKMSADEVDTLFILGDKNGDGAIDFAEFAEIMIPSAPERIAKLKKCFTELSISLRAAGFSDQEIQTVFALADHDRDGEVSLQELQSSLSHK